MSQPKKEVLGSEITLEYFKECENTIRKIFDDASKVANGSTGGIVPSKRITEDLALLKVMRGKMHNAMCFITNEEQKKARKRAGKRAAVVPETVNVDTKSMSKLASGELYNWSKTEKRWRHNDTQHQALRGAHAEVYHAYRAYKEILIELENAVEIAHVQSKGDAQWQSFPRHDFWSVSSNTAPTSPKTISPFENQTNLESVRQALPRDPSKQTKSAAFGRKLSQYTSSHPMTPQAEDDNNHRLYMKKLEEANPAGVDTHYISKKGKQGDRPWYTRFENWQRGVLEREREKTKTKTILSAPVIAIGGDGGPHARAAALTLLAIGPSALSSDRSPPAKTDVELVEQKGKGQTPGPDSKS